MSWHQLNFKNTCPFLLLKTIFIHFYPQLYFCFLSSVAKDGKDERGLKLENNGPTFSSFNALPAKNTEKLLLLILSYEICLLSS